MAETPVEATNTERLNVSITICVLGALEFHQKLEWDRDTLDSYIDTWCDDHNVDTNGGVTAQIQDDTNYMFVGDMCTLNITAFPI